MYIPIPKSAVTNDIDVINSPVNDAIIKINNNIPFIALSYEHKISGLLKSLNKEECMIDISLLSMNRERNLQLAYNLKKLLPAIKKDDVMRNKAKDIAYNCFNKFISYLEQEML